MVGIFILLSLISFSLGILVLLDVSRRNVYFKILTCLVILAPSYGILRPMFTQSGIYYYDFFIISFLPLLVVNIEAWVKIKKSIFSSLLVFGFAILLTGMINFEEIFTHNFIFIFKDIKPVLYLLFLYVFGEFIEKKQLVVDKSFLIKLLWVNFVIDTILYILQNTGVIYLGVWYGQTKDRYIDVSFLFVISFLFWFVTNNQRISLSLLLITVLPVLYSGNRTVILGILVVFGIYYMKNYKFGLVYSLVGGFLVGLLGLVVMKDRILDLFSIEYIQNSLTMRVLPFIVLMEDFSGFKDFIFGHGIGTGFYIPWFEHVEFSAESFAIDNLYLTLFPKYGLFAIAFLFEVRRFLNYCISASKTRYYLVLFFAIYSLTTSFIYQELFFPLIIGLFNINLVHKKFVV